MSLTDYPGDDTARLTALCMLALCDGDVKGSLDVRAKHVRAFYGWRELTESELQDLRYTIHVLLQWWERRAFYEGMPAEAFNDDGR